ncbi:MAG: hypothetical protein AAF570_18880, partial [Bacteroidota bacterium]
YFNQHAGTIALFSYLKPHFPDFPATALDRHTLFNHLFPKQPYDEQKLYEHIYYLRKLLRQFLVQQAFSENDFQQELLYLGQLRRRGQDQLYRQRLPKLQRKIATQKDRDEAYLHRRYLLASEGERYFTSHIQESQRTTDVFLQEKVDFLEQHYLAVRFKYSCEMLNRENILRAGYDLQGLPEAMHYYAAHPDRFQNAPAVNNYYLILKTLQESENESHYSELLALLDREADKFPPEEARSMYYFAQNYCIGRINQGQTDWFRRLFDLYRVLLDKGLMLQQGRLSQWDYKNIVTAGLRLEKYDWTRSFIEEYQHRLAPEHRANAYAYNLATWQYATGDRAQAQRLLQNVEFTDTSYQLGTRSILVMIYYEEDAMQPFFSAVDAFRIYLHRNKLLSERQTRLHKNFLRLVARMYKLRLRRMASRSKKVREDCENLARQVETAEDVANIVWLRKMGKRAV